MDRRRRARMEGVQSVSVKRIIYQALKYHGDYNAMRKKQGAAPDRPPDLREVTGRIARNLFG
jgi:hypothetical protein